MTKEKIPAAWVKGLLNYEPDTGQLTWAVASGRYGRISPGTKAGFEHTDSDGYRYRYVVIQSRQYRATHLAWAWMTGEWPKETIDHKNQDTLDDRWENLREATLSQQKQNNRRRKDSTTGYKCVVRYFDPRYRQPEFYRWQVVVNGKRIKSSQRYFTAKEAYEAYC